MWIVMQQGRTTHRKYVHYSFFTHASQVLSLRRLKMKSQTWLDFFLKIKSSNKASFFFFCEMMIILLFLDNYMQIENFDQI